MQADAPAMVQLHLRLPKKLHKRLMQRAKRNNTSLNTEIINQLEAALTGATDDRVPLQREDIAKIIKAALDSYVVPVPLSEIGTRSEREKEAGVTLKELLRRWPPDK
jgi:hypothetical protein